MQNRERSDRVAWNAAHWHHDPCAIESIRGDPVLSYETLDTARRQDCIPRDRVAALPVLHLPTHCVILNSRSNQSL
jgi:hypothetical protein